MVRSGAELAGVGRNVRSFVSFGLYISIHLCIYIYLHIYINTWTSFSSSSSFLSIVVTLAYLSSFFFMLTLYIENHLRLPSPFLFLGLLATCLPACGVVVCSSLPGMRDGILFHASIFDVTGISSAAGVVVSVCLSCSR